MGNQKVKAISLGAMIIGLFCTLSIIDLYLGHIFGYYLYFIFPSLIVYYIHHYGMKNGYMVSIAILLAILFTGNLVSIFYIATSIVAGLAIAYGHQKDISGNMMFALCVGISLLNNILSYTVFASLLGYNIIDEMKEVYEFASKLISMNYTLEYFLQYAPLLIMLFGLVEGAILLMYTGLILARLLKIKFKYQFNFMEVKIPWNVVLIFLVSLGLKMYKQLIYIDYVFFICYFLLAFQGFSRIAKYFLIKRKLVFYFASIIGLIIPVLQYFYIFIGVLDIVVGIKQKL